jgi:serine protease Do
MLRLLVIPLIAFGLVAARADEEPKKKPSTEYGQAMIIRMTEEPKNMASTENGLFENAQVNVARTDGSPSGLFTFVYQQDSDLILVTPDGALRSQLKLPKDRGLVAVSVRINSSTWEAGIRQNDILLTLDDAPLAKPDDLEEKLKQAGEKHLTLELLRKGVPVKLTVQPRVRVDFRPVESATATYWIGVGVSPIEPALRAQLDLPEQQGLVVTSVADGSPAGKSGLKVNDIILTATGHPLSDQSTLSELVQESEDKPLSLEYLREGARHTVQITPERHSVGKLVRKLAVFTSTVVRPGVVQSPATVEWNAQTPQWESRWSTKSIKPAPAPDASSKRLDEMAAEIKELRKAIDGLRKTLEDRK